MFTLILLQSESQTAAQHPGAMGTTADSGSMIPSKVRNCLAPGLTQARTQNEYITKALKEDKLCHPNCAECLQRARGPTLFLPHDFTEISFTYNWHPFKVYSFVNFPKFTKHRTFPVPPQIPGCCFAIYPSCHLTIPDLFSVLLISLYFLEFRVNKVIQHRGQHAFSVRGQITTISGLEGHTIAVTTPDLCWSIQAAVGRAQMANKLCSNKSCLGTPI